jgi:L-amino acid N-acyltransferase YncA
LNVPLDECVELDRLNMTPILAEAEETFSAAGRAAMLARSLATNGRLVGAWRDGRLVGYAELRFSEGRCAIWSIQVHPDYQRGPVLLALLRRIAESIDLSQVRVLASATHAVNGKSIRLHRLLGFHEIGRSGGKISFEAGAAELAARFRATGPSDPR